MVRRGEVTEVTEVSKDDEILLLKKALYALAEHTGGLHILQQFFEKPE